MARKKLDQSKITQLEMLREQSAFRHGTRAFRYGLISQAPSDHLPISALVKPSHAPALNLMSWSLLSDAHLVRTLKNQGLIFSQSSYCWRRARHLQTCRFFQQVVQRTVEPLVGQAASQLLGSSDPKLTLPVTLTLPASSTTRES